MLVDAAVIRAIYLFAGILYSIMSVWLLARHNWAEMAHIIIDDLFTGYTE